MASITDSNSPTTQALKDVEAQSRELFPNLAKMVKDLEKAKRSFDEELRQLDKSAHAVKRKNEHSEDYAAAFEAAEAARYHLKERIAACEEIRVRLRGAVDIVRDVQEFASTTLEAHSNVGQ